MCAFALRTWVSNFWKRFRSSTMHADMRSSSAGFPRAVTCSRRVGGWAVGQVVRLCVEVCVWIDEGRQGSRGRWYVP